MHVRAPLVALLGPAVLLGAALLAGCTAEPGTPPSRPAAASQRTPTSPGPPAATNGASSTPFVGPTTPGSPPQAQGGQDAPMDDHDDAVPTTQASLDAEAAGDAQERATAFLRAFGRTDLAQDAWWAGVQGYFTPQAAAIYASTDVANVPVTDVVEGSAALLEDTSTPYRAQVAVETEAGAYTVVLVRADGDWLVERATPPS